MNRERSTSCAIALAVSAAAFRLLPLGWLHPLNWDELEFFRVSAWIAHGRVPFRDFWEHHTPLAWYVFAPVAALARSPGVGAILVLRWAQIPIWIATFWVTFIFMRDAGLSRFARWAATAIALASSFLMISAVEIRIDPLAVFFYMTGLVFVQRMHARKREAVLAGVMFCCAGLTNMRLGPLLVATVLLVSVVDLRERRWRWQHRAMWMVAGGAYTLAVALLFFQALDAVRPLYRALIMENVIGDKYGQEITAGFVHRLLVPFGVRIIGSDRLFEWAAVDVGGISLLTLGVAGLVFALRAWRSPDDRFAIALLQIVSLAVIAGMNFIYNYHFQIAVVMMLPLIAIAVERIPKRSLVLSIVIVAWCVNAFASVFRGKELDLAYQDFVMRQLDARTKPGERVWGGIAWALHREPAYHFWFLPDMTRHLVRLGYAEPYRLERVIADPPAAIVFDHYALVWIVTVQRELAPFLVRHYIPVWRNLWIPAMNARLEPGATVQWIVPRDGTYRVFTSTELAKHRWFHDPLYVGAYDNADPRVSARLPTPGLHGVELYVDGARVEATDSIALRKHHGVAARNVSGEAVAVLLLSGNDTVLFRQPPAGATLEAATTRVTHVPRLGARIQP
jgi:hypothetical protein